MISVFLIDRHPLVRAGLKMIFSTASSISVCGEVETVDAAAEELQSKRPDVVLLDISGEEESALRDMDLIGQLSPDSKIIGLTEQIDQDMQISAIRHGADGIFLTLETPTKLLTAIQRVHSGKSWVDRSLAANLIRSTEQSHNDSGEMRILTLTPRERDVIKFISQGLHNQDIAERLSIAEKTVRNHLTIVYSKLQVSSRLELAVYSAQRHIQ